MSITSKIKELEILRAQVAQLAKEVIDEVQAELSPLLAYRAVAAPAPALRVRAKERRKRAKITPAIRQEVLQYQKKGKTIAEAALLCGISTASVANIRRAAKKQPGKVLPFTRGRARAKAA